MIRPYVLVIQFCFYFICIQAIDKRVLNGKPITDLDFGEYLFNKTSFNQFGQILTILNKSEPFWMSLYQFRKVGTTIKILFTDNQWSFMVSLHQLKNDSWGPDSYICVGSIISSYYVITAGDVLLNLFTYQLIFLCPYDTARIY